MKDLGSTKKHVATGCSFRFKASAIGDWHSQDEAHKNKVAVAKQTAMSQNSTPNPDAWLLHPVPCHPQIIKASKPEPLRRSEIPTRGTESWATRPQSAGSRYRQQSADSDSYMYIHTRAYVYIYRCIHNHMYLVEAEASNYCSSLGRLKRGLSAWVMCFGNRMRKGQARSLGFNVGLNEVS